MKKVLLSLTALCLALCGCVQKGNVSDASGTDTSGTADAFGETLSVGDLYGNVPQENDLTVTYVSGTEGCYTLTEDTLTFAGVAEDTVYAVSGTFVGRIVIDAGEYKFDLELCGLSLACGTDVPITVTGGDEVSLTAKKGTENFVYDKREAVGEDGISGAIHSDVDLEICGKGSLSVVSEQNNGIHGKDDLQVKNLALTVHCADNALKGNDSVEMTNCNAVLIATAGDGIKTSASDISDKGNRRGDVTVSDSNVTVDAACDGIDAAHDVTVGGETVLHICTDKYSSYTVQAEVRGGPGGGPGGRPGGPGGGFGGPGGMQEGNPDKAETSAKGIKAANAVSLEGGEITVKSYDDAVHASNGTVLESGESALGDITVSGGVITLYSNDDGLHADGDMCISGGTVSVLGSYEGLEGSTVSITAGDVSVVASDDGINSTGTSGEGVRIGGGTLYVSAGGDGIDSNSRDSYKGIVFAGGDAVLISSSGGNSAIDTERGYTYERGRVLALMPIGGMTSEAAHCSNFSSVATQKSVSASGVLCVKVGGETALEVGLSGSMHCTAIYLGSTDASFESRQDDTLDGVNWK